MSAILSVVIATRNRQPLLPELLDALDRQDAQQGSFEVILVDNGSEDATMDFLKGFSRPWLRVLSEPRRGAACARNSGLKAASGEVVLFLDDDMLPARDVLRLHQEAHAQTARASFLGAIDFRWERQTHPLSRYVALQEEIWHPFSESSGERLSFFRYYTAQVSSPRDAIVRAGGFDEGFAGYGYEDAELGYRLELMGLPLLYLPEARVVNREPHDPAVYWHKVESRGASQARCFLLHPELTMLDRRTRRFDRLGPFWSAYRRVAGAAMDSLAARIPPSLPLPRWVCAHYRLSTSAFEHRGWKRYLKIVAGARQTALPPSAP